jgi:hypothetical protein
LTPDCSIVEVSLAARRKFADTLLRPAFPFKAVIDDLAWHHILGSQMTLTRKKRVLLTGDSGSMGSGAFKELLRRRNGYDISLLLSPKSGRQKAYAKCERAEGIKIVWGDLRARSDVEEAVAGACASPALVLRVRATAWNYSAVPNVDPLISAYYYSNHSVDESQKVVSLCDDEESALLCWLGRGFDRH